MRGEVLGSVDRRRRWRLEDKVRIVEETLAPGAVICEVARRNGVSPSLVFTWRRQARRGELVTADAVLMPVVVSDAAGAAGGVAVPLSPAPLRDGASCGRGLIEIELERGRRLRVDRDVDADALARVLDVLGRR
jgi:transposase